MYGKLSLLRRLNNNKSGCLAGLSGGLLLVTGKTVAANYTINLFLSLTLNLGVEGHSQEEDIHHRKRSVNAGSV